MSSGYIDAHCHFYESDRVAHWVKETCDIWEYGGGIKVPYCSAAGTLDDLTDAVKAANLTHAVIVNCFSIDEWRDRVFNGLSEGLNVPLIEPFEHLSPLGQLLMGYNEWLLRTAIPIPQLVPFVSLDPWVLSETDLARHLSWLVSRGAKGVKLHPVAQNIDFSQPSALRLGYLVADCDIPLVIHTGKAKGSIPFGEIQSFTQIAKTPNVKLVLAHMGGAMWKQASVFAADHPDVLFDISELIAWLGAPNAPSPSDLVTTIRQIGPDHVIFGSDFPWYHPRTMLRVVEQLPGLTPLELSAITHDNAARHLLT